MGERYRERQSEQYTLTQVHRWARLFQVLAGSTRAEVHGQSVGAWLGLGRIRMKNDNAVFLTDRIA